MPSSPDDGFSSHSGYGQQSASYPPRHTPHPVTPPEHRSSAKKSVLTAVGVALAIALASAALIVSLTRGSEEAALPDTPGTSSPTATTGATAAADKALCEDIAPLMEESVEIGKRFVNLGRTGTPERDAGIPSFREEVEDWAERIQPILDEHAVPPRFLTRTLQDYVDDTRLYAASIRPGPESEFDRAAWSERVVAYGGAFAECPKYGVKWW
ncbi:hypothetical protein AU194_16055 [Mycobacterium sp. GA-2829]|nr:hypothetical protein AU194_16055 [Mycobacterium sp. GA-2829]